MKLAQFEQSGFVLETEAGFKLALDIGHYTPVEKLAGVSADGMLVSHIHADHLSPEQIKAINPKKLYLNRECAEALGEEELNSEIIETKAGEIFTIGEIRIEPFDVDHGPNIKVVPKENFGFLIEGDRQKVYFAGDMFYPSGIDVSDLEVDYALIPVGTFYTFGPAEAAAFVKTFKKIGEIIPMHYYKTPETKNEFLRLMKP